MITLFYQIGFYGHYGTVSRLKVRLRVQHHLHISEIASQEDIEYDIS